MKRRNFILSSAVVGSGAVAVGSGAFTSVAANRDINVDVAGDSNAFLRIAPFNGPNGAYAEETGGTLAIDLTGDNDAIDGGGEGINPSSVTSARRVFEIQNQGTQAVGVEITDPILTPEDGVGVGIFPEGQDPTEPIELAIGDRQVFSVVAAADDSIQQDPELPEETFEIVADAEVIQ